MKKRTITIIYSILLFVFVFSAWKIIKTQNDYHKAEEAYSELQIGYIKIVEDEIPSYDIADSGNKATPEPEMSVEVDFGSLIRRNSDVIGWIYGLGTVINYPVVRGQDNDYYLMRGIDGNYLVTGSLFADYRSGRLEEPSLFIIYGHNMKNGTMFGALEKYKDPAYYEEHPILYYITPNGDYMIELYAGLVVNHDSEIYATINSWDNYEEMMKGFKSKSYFASDVTLPSVEEAIVLSTCSYEYDEARYIIIGKLVPTIL